MEDPSSFYILKFFAILLIKHRNFSTDRKKGEQWCSRDAEEREGTSMQAAVQTKCPGGLAFLSTRHLRLRVLRRWISRDRLLSKSKNRWKSASQSRHNKRGSTAWNSAKPSREGWSCRDESLDKAQNRLRALRGKATMITRSVSLILLQNG